MNERLVKVRKALKLTQAEFGNAIGLTASGISDIESGRRVFQERHVKLILATFPQISERWLRDGIGEMFLSDASPVRQIMAKYQFKDYVEKLLIAFDRLDPQEQAAVLRFVQEYVAEITAGIDAGEETPPFGQEENIDEEVEANRRQLIAQKMEKSSRSDGGGAIVNSGR